MTPPRAARDLPGELSPIFRVGDALDLDGVSEIRLRAGDLDSRVWGVRASAGYGDTLAGRCELFARRVDDRAFFSHSTAALLLGIPIPHGLARRAELHLAMPAPHRAPHSAGLIGHQLRVTPADLIKRGPLRLTSPARTWRDLASNLSLPDLVAAGDRVLWRKAPMADIERLRAVLPTTPVRGAKKLHLALPLLTDRADSPPESFVRVALIAAGLPWPEPNFEVPDERAGHSWWVDLAYPAARLAIEYQGDYRRDPEQWRADLRRRARLEALGWRVLELTADDLRGLDDVVERIRAILAGRTTAIDR